MLIILPAVWSHTPSSVGDSPAGGNAAPAGLLDLVGAMEKHVGECVGGPYDGQMLAHWARSKKFFRPMAPYMPAGDPPLIPVTIGEYRLNDFRQWHWWPTSEGKALESLVGPVQV